MGHALESQKKHDQALVLFKEAAKVQHDDIGAHINIGRALNQLARSACQATYIDNDI